MVKSGNGRTEAAVAEMSGKVIAAGGASLLAVSRLMGLDGPKAPGRLTAVAWIEQSVQVAVDFGHERPTLFTFSRRSENTQGLVLTDHLAVSHGRISPPQSYSEWLRSRAGKLLGETTLDDLAKALSADPELGAPGLAMPFDDVEDQHPRSLLDTWGESDAYADFFAVGEVARGQLDSLSVTDFFLFVQHADAECHNVHPRGIAPLQSLVSFPWDDRLRTDREPQLSVYSGPDSYEVMFTTELDEDDVIMGNPGKVRRVLDVAAKVAEERGRTLFFSNTCLPIVTGEDVASELKRCQANCSCDTLYLTVDPRSMVNVFHDAMVARRIDAEGRVDSVPKTINIIGLAPSRGADELQELLAAIGIEVNEVLIPDLTYEMIENLPRASLNVFVPNDIWQHHYDQLAVDTRIPHIQPPAPWGLEQTRRWLHEVANTLEVTGKIEEAISEHWKPWQQRWNRVRKEARNHRLGLVVRGEEVYHLTLPSSTWGVPIITLLEEMGFGLDILLKLRDREQARRVSHEVHSLFSDPKRHSIKGFNSLEMMLERLDESPCEAVLTYQGYDWRVTQAGKGTFSLQHLEVGMQGAVRSAERLIGICKTPFYKRYGRFLKRTPEGARLRSRR